MDSLIPVPQKINEGPSLWPLCLSWSRFFVNLRHRHRAVVCSSPPLVLGGDSAWGRQHRPSHQGVLPGEVGKPKHQMLWQPPLQPQECESPTRLLKFTT